MLKVVDLSKSFPGVNALQKVNLTFYPGKVNALIGENGAGKSTLLKILTGEYPDYEGEIYLHDQLIRFKQVKEAQQAGISIIHQELNLVPELTIAENIFLGREIHTGWGWPNQTLMMARAKELLAQLGFQIAPETLVKNLRVGEQQLVEIAKALYSDAQIILMDEPTSALSDKEIERLHHIIFALKHAEKTIVYITHKMHELFKIADTFTVLRDGQAVAAGNMQEISESDLIRFMVGRDMVTTKKQIHTHQIAEILSVHNLTILHPTHKERKVLDNISFTLHQGEIVGFFGLLGAGRTELLSALFGINSQKRRGQIKLFDQEVKINSPREAMAHGLALVTEDRKSEGLILGMNVEENISLTTLPEHGWLDIKNEQKRAQNFIAQLNIKTPSVKQQCVNLSGGNQQKIVLAKWLSIRPKILMLDEPTRGIDIHAKNEIYELIRHLAAEGQSIIIASSEIPELLALCDRIYVLSEGKITAEFTSGQAQEDKLLQYALPKENIA